MSSVTVSPQRREEVLDALRRGTVPASSLDLLAVGLERFEPTILAELDAVRTGRGVLKAVRGEYGSGKTFLARWLQETALRRGFATAEVQISETETPLHRLETVYRRLVERLSTVDCRHGALRSIVDGWFFTLERRGPRPWRCRPRRHRRSRRADHSLDGAPPIRGHAPCSNLRALSARLPESTP